MVGASGAFAGSATHLEGQDGDAGDRSAAALAVPADGAYWGATNRTDPADWYRSEPVGTAGGAGTCYTIVTAATRTMGLTVGLDDGDSTRVGYDLPPDVGVGLGLAGRGHDVLIGWDRLEDRRTAYSFELARHTAADLGPGDGATGGDAGDTVATGIALAGPCTAGSLDMLQGDKHDVYLFNGTAGDAVVVSFASSSDSNLQLVPTSPSGTQFRTVEPGDTQVVELTETGTWALEVDLLMTSGSTTDATSPTYLIGISAEDGDGPRPRPCRPACFDSV